MALGSKTANSGSRDDRCEELKDLLKGSNIKILKPMPHHPWLNLAEYTFLKLKSQLRSSHIMNKEQIIESIRDQAFELQSSANLFCKTKYFADMVQKLIQLTTR